MTTLREIERKIADTKDGILACYETIEMGRKKLERLERERQRLHREGGGR